MTTKSEIEKAADEYPTPEERIAFIDGAHKLLELGKVPTEEDGFDGTQGAVDLMLAGDQSVNQQERENFDEQHKGAINFYAVSPWIEVAFEKGAQWYQERIRRLVEGDEPQATGDEPV